MSSKKRPPLTDTISSSHKTPHYAPSTPHARRALEQRSATKLRSARAQKLFDTIRRPDSTRGILKRLAKATAAVTAKRVVTPVGDKENVDTDDGMLDDDGEEIVKPHTSLEDVSEDEDDSDLLPAAPTPSILAEDGDPTLTFKAVELARQKGPASERPRRRSSRMSSFHIAEDADVEEDGTILSEVGRRARSEGPLDDVSRISFGSIRMSDFGRDWRQRQEDGKVEQVPLREDEDGGNGFGDDTHVTDGAETLDLRRLQRSPSQISAGDLSVQFNAMEDDDMSFRLQVPEEQQSNIPKPFVSPREYGREDQPREDDNDEDWEQEEEVQVSSKTRHSPDRQSSLRKQTSLELASSKPRRKRMKQTKTGAMIPSLPSSLIKRIAIDSRTRLGKRKPVLGRDHMKALDQATEWFFEQVGEDLEVFSNHAKRKKRIDESDVLTLMKRQRVLREPDSLHALAREFLPGEMLKELDFPDHL